MSPKPGACHTIVAKYCPYHQFPLDALSSKNGNLGGGVQVIGIVWFCLFFFVYVELGGVVFVWQEIIQCSIYMRLWWLQYCGSQKQFHYYWDVESKNWADYSTIKHHPDIYNKAHRSTHTVIWNVPQVSLLVLPPQ